MRCASFHSAAAWIALASFSAVPQVIAQQTKQAAAPQTTASLHDLSGFWVLPGDHYNKKDKTEFPESAWSIDKLPFTPAGRAAFDANKPLGGPRQVKSELSNDPRDQANPAGLYRTLQYSTSGRTFEFIQLPNKVIQHFSFGLNWRNIYTDGRPVPDDVAAGPFWYGYSVGHWDGDTLVVTTLSLDDRQWLDAWGTPVSTQARVEERWKRIAPNKLQLQITVNDPVYYSKPWTSVPFTYDLKPGGEPEEIIFAPMDMAHFTQSLLVPSTKQTTK